MLKAVIFDCDGVLVDSETLTNQIMRDSLAQYGLEMTLAQTMQAFVGGTIAGVAVTARSQGANLPDDWVAQIYAEMFEGLAASVEPIAGAADVLDWLDVNRIPYAVGSNGPMRKMEITLPRCGMWDRLEGRVLSAQNFPNPKPAPDIYLAAAELLGVSPDQAVVIEDSASGAEAARRAGMRCFGYAPDGPHEKLVATGAHLFHSMADLPGLLAGLQK